MSTVTHLLIHRFIPGTGPQPGTPEHDHEMAQWSLVDERLRAAGILVGGYALAEGGTLLSPDGAAPLDEHAETVFAVHAVSLESDDEAEALARDMPTSQYGSVEIRSIMD